jgi:hypothetical protein
MQQSKLAQGFDEWLNACVWRDGCNHHDLLEGSCRKWETYFLVSMTITVVVVLINRGAHWYETAVCT